MKKLYVVCFLFIAMLCISSCNNTATTGGNSNKHSSEIVETTKSFNTKKTNIAISAIKDVIMNKTRYLCTENNQLVYLKDPHSENYLIINDKGFYEYFSGDDGKVNFIFTYFCVLDMDGDGNPEILLQSESSNIFLFHYENNVVYGYVFPFRGLLNLKKDSSFRVSGGLLIC